MSSQEFESLRIGDQVQYQNGPDVGKVFEVIFIEDYKNVCLRAQDGQSFARTASNSLRKDVKLKVSAASSIKKI